jgi:hypothetical protein
MAFNLDNYEDVNARIKRFRFEFPTGRLECYIEDIDIKAGYILVKALAFRNYEDEKPAATDYAYEVRDSSKINANWWVENCVTSAYGRVIGALTPSEARPTRQDMERVQRIEDDHKSRQDAAHGLLTAYEIEQMKVKAQTDQWSNPVPSMAEAIESLQAGLGGQIVPQSPVCKHGHMLEKSGTSDKTGKAYHGYTCPSKSRQDQCAPIWWKQVDGQWLSPSDYQDYLNERGR